MSNQQVCAEKALDQRARRKAKRVGLLAQKSRRGVGGIDNYGGFMLVDPNLNTIEAGHRFDLSAEDVIEHCAAV